MFCVKASGSGGPCFSDCPLVSSSSAEAFGPPLWFTLHTMAANYPEIAQEARQSVCAAFLDALPEMLPCARCGAHLREALTQRSVSEACSSREGLAALFCDIHNEVNDRSGKERMDCSSVVAQYARTPLCATRSTASAATRSSAGGSSSSEAGAEGGACACAV